MASTRAPLDQIDAFVAEQMGLSRAPGLALTVLHDGETVVQRGYGYADLAAGTLMTERSGVVIGSTTKALTCLAVMQLAERGLLALDDPITRHLPAFRVQGAGAEGMTLRHALTHTAGLRPSAADHPWFLFSDDETPDALERYIDSLAGSTLLWPPGAGWVYANDGYVIAGRIIEVLSGLPYEEYLRRNVLTPLGLRDSGFSPDEQPGMQVATPYDYDADGTPYPSFRARNHASAAAGSQLIMSARDAGRWLQAMLDGGRADGVPLVSPAGHAELLRPWAEVAPEGRGPGAAESRYALGWSVGPVDGVPAISHGGATITMGSRFILVPEQRLAVAVVANSVSEVTAIVGDGVMSLMLGRRPVRSFPRLDRSFEPDRTAWPRLAGTYHAAVPQNKVTGPWRLRYEDGRLWVRTYPGDERRRPGDIFLYAQADGQFVLFGRGRTGGLASFNFDGDTVRGTWEGVAISKAVETQQR